MDPNATLSELLDLLKTLGDDIYNDEDADMLEVVRDAIVEQCDALRDWIAKGGFPPCVPAIARMHS